MFEIDKILVKTRDPVKKVKVNEVGSANTTILGTAIYVLQLHAFRVTLAKNDGHIYLPRSLWVIEGRERK
jgi:hypothetical protein